MGRAWVGQGRRIQGNFQISSAGRVALYEMLSHKFYNWQNNHVGYIFLFLPFYSREIAQRSKVIYPSLFSQKAWDSTQGI